jgi:acyl-CoA thioesterase-1
MQSFWKNIAYRHQFWRAIVFVLASWLAALVACNNDNASKDIGRQTPQAATASQGTIVALGDSLTAGLGVEQTMAYPAQLERKLHAAGYAYKVINAGVSGETSSGTLSRIQWVVSNLRPDIIILETGANDGMRGIDPRLLESNLNKLIQYLDERKIIIVLAGMKMLPNLGPDYTAAFGRIYPALAQKHALVFMPFFLEGIAGDPELNQADGIHPTARGYARLVENLFPYAVQAIKKHKPRFQELDSQNRHRVGNG